MNIFRNKHHFKVLQPPKIGLLFLMLILGVSCSTVNKKPDHPTAVKIYHPIRGKIQSYGIDKNNLGKKYFKSNKVANRMINGNEVNAQEIMTHLELYTSFLAANNNERMESLYTKSSEVPLLSTETIAYRNLEKEEYIQVIMSFFIKYDGLIYHMDKVLHYTLTGEKEMEVFFYIQDENDYLLFTTEFKDEKLRKIFDLFYHMKPKVLDGIFGGYEVELPSSGDKRLDMILERESNFFIIQNNINLDRFIYTIERWKKENKKGLLNYFFEK